MTSRDGMLEIAMGFSWNQSVDNHGICYSGSSLVTGIHGLWPSWLEVFITPWLRALQMTALSCVPVCAEDSHLTQNHSPSQEYAAAKVALQGIFPLIQGNSVGPSQFQGHTRNRQRPCCDHISLQLLSLNQG